MADFLWTFAVQETLKKVLKVLSEQIGVAWGIEKNLSNLQKWLLKAEAFVCDINTRKLHHPSVKIWVDDLQHLVYRAENLLDEIDYEHLRQKVKTSKMKKVCDFISPSSNPFIFRRNMAKKVTTVIELLEKHYNEAAPLGLVGNESTRPEIDVISQFRETTSKLDDYEIVGRDVEVESIVKQVIDASNQQVASILPIVGMGGLGKTTLAKLVFNHELIQKHFDKTIWVCVSEPFIVNKILGEILQNLKPTFNCGDNREVLLRELQNEVLGKTYFLVLDDVWNEDACRWDQLKNCLPRIIGNSENCIVVTTRNIEVAKIMETCPSHHLSKLSDNQCWSLFKESANAGRLSETTQLESHRKELVKKIGGIPLVARVLGRAVKFEEDDERREKMLESVLKTQHPQEKFALSILKLSVDHLPSSSLKQCFAYCSNFPKDFDFKRKELVQMWMAQGFIIQPQDEGNNTTIENVGDVYFNIMLSRCLFQDARRDEEGRTTSCKMHDLLHDIACEMSNDQKLTLNPSNMLENELRDQKENKIVASKLRTINYVKKIRDNIDHKVFDLKIGNYVCLRVLKMHLFSTDKLQLLNSIGQLKYLRYLELSSDFEVIKFPKSMCLLYHLETLNVKGLQTKELPKNITNLVSLRHLEFSADVEKMPPSLSQLTQLQTLPYFVVGFEKDCKIIELGPLKNLQGRLRICCLEKVESKEEACRVDLANKENLDKLEFFWSSTERKDNMCNDLEVLEGLQPHKNLKSLEIHHFAGNRLPNKVFFENFREIRLQFCENCEWLPMLGELKNLKNLFVYSLKGVRSIGSEFYGNDSKQKTFFPKLEHFELSDMMNLEQWEEIKADDASSNVITFPHLKWLKIDRCPELLNIPDIFGGCDENDVQHLKSLKISHCSELTRLPNGLDFCGSIKVMKIEKCSKLSINLENKPMLFRLSIGSMDKLPREELGHLMNIEGIKIVGCMDSYDFSFLQHLPSLVDLALSDESSSVIQLPQQLQLLTALQFLSLENFGGIEALPEWLGNLASLRTLCLFNCQNLKQLASTEAMLRLTQLYRLFVDKCPLLQLGEGDTEGVKLTHLSNINVYRCHIGFIF